MVICIEINSTSIVRVDGSLFLYVSFFPRSTPVAIVFLKFYVFLPIFLFVFNFNFLVFILFLISAYCSIVSLVCIILLFVRCAQNFKYRAQQATYVDIFGPLWNRTKLRAKSWTRIQSWRIEKNLFFWQLYASVFVRKIESQIKREKKDIWSKWMKS